MNTINQLSQYLTTFQYLNANIKVNRRIILRLNFIKTRENFHLLYLLIKSIATLTSHFDILDCRIILLNFPMQGNVNIASFYLIV